MYIYSVTTSFKPLSFPFPAKVLWLGRLQHGEGQDQEQAASSGTDGEGRDHGRPHPHPSGPAAEETLSGGQQTGWLIPAAVLYSTLPLPVSSSTFISDPAFLPSSFLISCPLKIHWIFKGCRCYRAVLPHCEMGWVVASKGVKFSKVFWYFNVL